MGSAVVAVVVAVVTDSTTVQVVYKASRY